MKEFKKLTAYDESIRTTTSNSTKPLLDLGIVSGRSEQLVCIHPLSQLRIVGKNITCLKCQSTWIKEK